MSLRVVFDFGAVLLRWRPAVVLQQTLSRQTSLQALRDAQAAVFQAYGGDWGDFDLGRVEAEELAERIHRRSGLSLEGLKSLIAAVPDELQVQPAVLSLLLQLRARGQRCSFLSNMPTPYAAQLQARLPLQTWFDSGVFSGHEHLSKPDARIFELAASRYGSAPADCLLIDDHPTNVEAARAAGWQAHLFLDAPGLQRELQARGLLT